MVGSTTLLFVYLLQLICLLISHDIHIHISCHIRIFIFSYIRGDIGYFQVPRKLLSMTVSVRWVFRRIYSREYINMVIILIPALFVHLFLDWKHYLCIFLRSGEAFRGPSKRNRAVMQGL